MVRLHFFVKESSGSLSFADRHPHPIDEFWPFLTQSRGIVWFQNIPMFHDFSRFHASPVQPASCAFFTFGQAQVCYAGYCRLRWGVSQDQRFCGLKSKDGLRMLLLFFFLTASMQVWDHWNAKSGKGWNHASLLSAEKGYISHIRYAWQISLVFATKVCQLYHTRFPTQTQTLVFLEVISGSA